MKLSIVIVNYNVQHFLESCLQSVMVACEGIAAEIFVVDNDSVDGSVAMVQARFPQVELIANKENVGFSRANNQAMRLAAGELILLLNPDTLVEADTFRKVIVFMDSHPDCGGLGIKMVDGKGSFLPESKRSLPTPEVAFYKIFGLSWLFPRSKRFGRYHLTYLNNDETHEIEVLSGAFMLMRKEALDKVGLLDEDFFMYGEDVDLSYRIIKGGWKNYYFPDARIIHYKGESTKKGSLNYVYVFYNAMAIFARKHFSAESARMFSLLINVAIVLRATVALGHRFVKAIVLPLADGAVIYGGLYVISQYWESTVRADDGLHFPDEFFWLALPSYILIWLLAVWFAGGYDRPVRLQRILLGLMAGSGVILIGYGLLGEEIRFSRAVILLGSLWAMMAVPLLRLLFHAIRLDGFDLSGERNTRFAIVGGAEEVHRVEGLLRETFRNPQFIGHVAAEAGSFEGALGTVHQLDDIIRIHRVTEVIFCAKDMPAQRIIDIMTQSLHPQVDFKIAPQESMFLIGSNDINTAGDLYTFGLNAVSKPSNRRLKRLFDLGSGILLLLLSPALAWFTRRPLGLFSNVLLVLLGRRTWVGYASGQKADRDFQLPKIAQGILSPVDGLEAGDLDAEGLVRINMRYAKDYSALNDLNILIKGLRNLGR
ncbi:MAG: glycosyltransferase family 2 protein [Flavobacteriales bacterium]|nr:glycosyltransferase family 2 protein [Flavobacteriales bacterium]